MKAVKFFKATTFSILALISFNACEDAEEVKATGTNITSIEEDALVSNMSDQIISEVDYTTHHLDASSSLKNETQQDSCPQVYFNTTETGNFAKEIVIDYGTENCKDHYGHFKRGKIIISQSGRYKEQGAERNVRFEDFYFNDYKIEGTKTFWNEGENDEGHILFYISVKDFKISSPEGLSYTRNSERLRKWVAGMDTPDIPWDDEFMITGASKGTNVEGMEYSREIITPLHKTRTCRFFLSGSVEIKIGETSAVLDYGTGKEKTECDNLATLTHNGETSTIELGRHHFTKRD